MTERLGRVTAKPAWGRLVYHGNDWQKRFLMHESEQVTDHVTLSVALC